MRADIRWLWTRLNANYWFYPALFAALAAVLSSALVALDRSGYASWVSQAEWLIPARPNGASNMLTVIAGSMIGVASTVFSITIAAVAYASGTYGPRLLTNFMEDKGNQLSLATFIGTFVYALGILRTVRTEDERPATLADAVASPLPGFVPQLSLLFAYVLMALSVAVLVYFLNHVPSGIRINTVIKRIGKRLLDDIAEIYPDKGSDDAPPLPHDRGTETGLAAQRTGYVQMIDYDALSRLAKKHERHVALCVRTGDFVHPGVPLLHLSGDEPLADDLARDLRDQFNCGPSRTAEQDPQFLFDELVEIGLRALSPGMNDPFTAITALHWLGAATAEIGTRRLVRDEGRDDDDDDADSRAYRAHPLPDDFAHYVARGFGTIASAVATSPAAAQVMLAVIGNAARVLPSGPRRALLLAEGARLMAQARLELRGPALALVEEAFTALNRDISPDHQPLPV